MRMTLFTNSKRIDDHRVDVAYQSHGKRGGVVSVLFDQPNDEMEICAEMCAMRFLVIEQEIFNVTVRRGSSIGFVVSRGAIRKIAQGKVTDKQKSYQYAGFLRTRLSGCKLETARKPRTEVLQFDRPENDEATEDYPYLITNYTIDAKPLPYEPVETAVGTLYVTQHALNQFYERSDNGRETKRLWGAFLLQIENPELREVPLPDNVIKHKMRKYGNPNLSEAERETQLPKVYNHPTSNLYFLTVNGVILTVFTK